jgi:hypothetical protein
MPSRCARSSSRSDGWSKSATGEVEQRVQLVAAEGVALGGALHLDERAAILHDDVHVGLRRGVLEVVEVEHRHAAADADRHGGDLAVQRRSRERAAADQRVAGVGERDIAAGDRGGARAAVGLQHVAVEGDGALAERGEVDDRAQAAADEALDLLGAAALLALGRLARRARMRGARQHAVFGGDPALALAAQEARHAILDRRGAEHARVAELHQHRALGMAREAALEADRAQLVGRAATGTASHAHAGPSQRSTTPVVLSAPGPATVIARFARAPSASDRVSPGFDQGFAIASSSSAPHRPSEQASRTSPGSSLRRPVMVISGSSDSPPTQHSTKLRIGWACACTFADEPLADQELDVAVVTRALRHAAAAHEVDAAVADVRPVGRVALHQADRAGGAGPLLERQLRAERDDGLVHAAQGEMQEAERVEQRLRRVPEGLDQQLLRRLCRERPVGMAAHAVHDDHQRGVFGHGDRTTILIVVAAPEEARLGVFDAQRGHRHSARLRGFIHRVPGQRTSS